MWRNKRLAQLAYQEALNADRQLTAQKKQENQENERQASESFNAGGSQTGVSQIGAASSTSTADQRANLKQQLALQKLDVIRKIAEDSSPVNSPRARGAAQFHVDDSAAGAAVFCIGESEDVVRRRKAEQKQLYLQQLDADTGGSRGLSTARRAYDYDANNGVTSFPVGLGKPSLDMSPSMKNLHHDSKRAKQDEYRQLLSQQQAEGKAIKAAEAAANFVDASNPLPYMRY